MIRDGGQKVGFFVQGLTCETFCKDHKVHIFILCVEV